jgi:thiol-disulfide isomerase/thioredoxin
MHSILARSSAMTRRWARACLLACACVALCWPAGEALAACGAGSAHSHHEVTGDDPDSGAELIGHPAPVWSFERWIRSKPTDLQKLRGKVVLLRWWTDGCHFCAATLPEIEELRRRHAADGLVVIGVFHPKPPRPVSDKQIVATAEKLGYHGPIAVDGQWRTLERYWLSGHPERNWTSVSFLIDRRGTLRWVHGGGEYHRSDDPRHQRCTVQFGELERALAEALAEPTAAVR